MTEENNPLDAVLTEKKSKSKLEWDVEDADPLIKSHAVHWLACLESYEQPQRRRLQVGDWKLIYGDRETCAYRLANRVCVAFRGTADVKDLYDDSLIIQGKIYPRFLEALEWVKKLQELNNTIEIELTGHSLGGAIAEKVAASLNLPSCTFNAAAPPTNHIKNHPGSVNFHIVYDMISAWQSPVIRIDKGYKPKTTPWYITVPYIWTWTAFKEIVPSHSLDNFSNIRNGFVTTTEEENKKIRNWLFNMPYHGRLMILDLLLGGGQGQSLPDIQT